MDRLRTIRVLLVEDNPDDVEITRRALSKSQVPNVLHVARDGQEAIEFLFGERTNGTLATTPDLILLDLNLPKVDGIEVLQRVRSSKTHSVIPVIVLSSSDREEDVTRSYRLGSNTYIQKPVEFDAFFYSLEILAVYWIVIARLPHPTR